MHLMRKNITLLLVFVLLAQMIFAPAAGVAEDGAAPNDPPTVEATPPEEPREEPRREEPEEEPRQKPSEEAPAPAQHEQAPAPERNHEPAPADGTAAGDERLAEAMDQPGASVNAGEQPAADPLLDPAPIGELAPEPVKITDVTRYLVDFYGYDGTRIASQYVEEGESAVQPRPPAREGYAFAGWAPSVDSVTSDMETRATYTKLHAYAVIVNHYFENGDPAAKSTKEFYMEGEAVDKTYYPVQIAGYEAETPSFTVQTDAIDRDYTVDFVYNASTNTTYTQEHLFEQFNGSYVSDPKTVQRLTGPTGAFVQAAPLPSEQTVGFSVASVGEGHIAADGSTVLQVKYQRMRFTIVFETGEGSVYIEPVVLQYGAPIPLPGAPVRAGYSFDRWVVSSSPIHGYFPETMPTEDLVLTAQWTPQTVPYQIIYWLEKTNIDGDPGDDTDNYEFSKQETRQAKAGSGLSLAAGDLGSVAYAAFSRADSNVVVKGDGSTIINAYFKRTVYTVTFSMNTDDPAVTMRFGGQNYTIRNPYVINVKYQQNIGSIWPSLKTAVFSGSFAGWRAFFDSTSWVTHRFIFTDDMIPPKGTAYSVNALWDPRVVTSRVNYWLEALDGQGGKSYKGPDGGLYILSAYDSQDVSHVSSVVNPKAIAGMEAGQRPANLQFRAGAGYIGDYSTTDISNYAYEFNFFYRRLRYTLSFNAQGGIAAPPSAIVPYGDALSKYDPHWDANTKYRDISGVTHAFDGWYLESTYLTPVRFDDTMPNRNLSLFAKWKPETFTVLFVCGEESESAHQEVSGGDPVQPYTPTRQGYVFLGWYKDRALTQPFSYAEKIYRDTTLYARWNAGYTSYTVLYLLNDPSGEPVAGHAAKEIQSVRVGDTITEQAAAIESYFSDSISKSLTLTADPTMNTIAFYYVRAESGPYTVRYLDSDTNGPIPGVAEKHGMSSSARIVENYRAIAGYTPQRYQISAWLSTDPQQNVLTFYYDANEASEYTVQHMIQMGIRNDGTPIYRQYGQTETKQGSVGSIAVAEPLDLSPQYAFVGGNEPQVIRPNAPIHMVLYYDALQTVTFVAEPGGILTGQAIFEDIPSGTFFSTITPPAPTPKEGYVFLGWDRSFPERVTQDWLFTARFEGMHTLSVTAGSARKTYDGRPLEDATYAFDENALFAGHRLEIFTTGAITRVGKTPNVLTDAIVYDQQGNDVTRMYRTTLIDGELEVTPAAIPLVIAAASDAKHYDGKPLVKPEYLCDAPGLVPGNSVQATVEGAITLPGTAPNRVTAWQVTDDQGADVSENYLVSLAEGTLTVLPAEKALTVTAASATKRYDGTPLEAPAYETGGAALLAGDTLTATVAGSVTDVGSAKNTVASWRIVNANGEDVSSAYRVNTVDGLLTVIAAEEGVLITAASATKQYDGMPLTDPGFTYDKTLLAWGHSLAATVQGSITQAGTAENTVVSWQITDGSGADVTANYRVAAAGGLLTVLPVEAPITVTAASAIKEYDGAPLTNPACVFDEALLLPGDAMVAEAHGAITDAGSAPNVAATWRIRNAAGEDVTACYRVTPVDGLLTVLPKAVPVTVTAASQEKTYDGQPLVDPGFTYDQSQLVAGHRVEAEVAGAITDVGETRNRVVMQRVVDSEGRDVSGNYRLLPRDGTLTILPRAETVVITAASDSKVYDRKPLTNPGYTFDQSLLLAGHRLSATVEGSIVQVGTTDNAVKKWAIVDAAGNDVSVNYQVEAVKGILTVVPRNITLLIQAKSAVKFYDGTPLTDPVSTYDTALLAEGDTLNASVDGSIVDAGTVENIVTSFRITGADGEDAGANYTVAVAAGKLTVLPKPALLVITAASGQKRYDGTPLVNAAYTFDASLLLKGHTLTAAVQGSITDVGTADNVVTAWSIRNENGHDVTRDYTVQAKAGTLSILPQPAHPEDTSPPPAVDLAPRPTPAPGTAGYSLWNTGNRTPQGAPYNAGEIMQ
jgi:uncharacterized repeat protein (TIGR02543 family)